MNIFNKLNSLLFGDRRPKNISDPNNSLFSLTPQEYAQKKLNHWAYMYLEEDTVIHRASIDQLLFIINLTKYVDKDKDKLIEYHWKVYTELKYGSLKREIEKYA
jgi:hypothetical protein